MKNLEEGRKWFSRSVSSSLEVSVRCQTFCSSIGLCHKNHHCKQWLRINFCRWKICNENNIHIEVIFWGKTSLGIFWECGYRFYYWVFFFSIVVLVAWNSKVCKTILSLSFSCICFVTATEYVTNMNDQL